MGRLVVTENVTLDGVIEQEVDDWFSPAGEQTDADDADLASVLRRHMRAQAALLLGRRTFETMRGYWPAQTDDTTGVADHLNRVPKYVVSRTLRAPNWEHTTVLGGDPVGEAQALARQTDGEVGVTGSITLVHALVQAGVVDEYRLFVYPVVVGRGRRLFEDAVEVPRLALVEATPFRSGVVLLTYRPREGAA